MPPLFHKAPEAHADLTSPIDNTKLRGKSVLVTGGASGLGAAMAKDFAEAGAFVTIADMQTERGKSDAKSHTEKGYHVQFVQTDVTDWSSQLNAFKKAIQFSPSKSIDVVVPCAGLGGGAFITSKDPPSLDVDPTPPSTAVIDVNLTGVYYSTYLALYYFRIPSELKSDKSLVFISSLAGYLDLPFATAYNGAKFGVRGIWRSLRGGVGQMDPPIRVNLIAPWFIKTPMTVEITKSIDDLGYAWAPIEGVVDAAVRCAADEKIKGRAIAILPDGNLDLGDDVEGADAGIALKKVMEQAKGGQGGFLT